MTVRRPPNRRDAYIPDTQSARKMFNRFRRMAWLDCMRVRSANAVVRSTLVMRVEIDSEHYPNDRFARIHDPEGNPIGLWQGNLRKEKEDEAR